MQYTMPIQSAGGRHHPVARRLIILAALISADVGSEQATKAMFGKARQRLWVVVNLSVIFDLHQRGGHQLKASIFQRDAEQLIITLSR